MTGLVRGYLVDILTPADPSNKEVAAALRAEADRLDPVIVVPPPPPPPPPPPAPTPSQPFTVVTVAGSIVDQALNIWSLSQAVRNGHILLNGVDRLETANVISLEMRPDGAVRQTIRDGRQWDGRANALGTVTWTLVTSAPLVPPPPPPPPSVNRLNRNGLVPTFIEEFDALNINEAETIRPINGRFAAWLNNDTNISNNRNNAWSHTLNGAGEDQWYVHPHILRQRLGSASVATLNPFSLADGALRITARRIPNFEQNVLSQWGASSGMPLSATQKQWVSGVLSTHGIFQQQYGVFEMRARLPDISGAWPAFWALRSPGNTQPELDVVDNYNSAATNQINSGLIPPDGPGQGQETRFPFEVAGVFHTFSVDWDATRIIYYLDDEEYLRIPTPASFHVPMYWIINLAIVDSSISAWADPIINPGLTSISMDIDWIRFWRRG